MAQAAPIQVVFEFFTKQVILMYITVMQPPMYRQMSLDDFLFGDDNVSSVISSNQTNTRTYVIKHMKPQYMTLINFDRAKARLAKFVEDTKELREADRASLYDTFHIPKKSGGLRRIDAPKPELMSALRNLKEIFETDFNALYHTSAFAYVKGRCTIDAVKRHQQNKSRWFAKLDLHDFFGSTTLDFVMNQLSEIFPFNLFCSDAALKEQLKMALELAFLNGKLPQGTPLSPLITNVMMIPIDLALSSGLRDFNGQRFVYTRYADDFLISSKYDFEIREVEQFVVDTLKSFSAPFSINAKKTRYGSSSGSNWNLGVMLNKDNEITIGHRKKREFSAMLHNYIMDRRNGIAWDKHDIQVMQGYYNYYSMIEPKAINDMIDQMNVKLGVNILRAIKDDLS